MKKQIATLLSIAIAISALAGCGANSSANDPVTIQTATSFGKTTAAGPAYTQLLTDFGKSNPHITVKDNSVFADDNWKATIRSQFEGNIEPDVMFFFNSADVSEILSAKKIVSVDEIREVYPNYASNIKPEAIEAMTEKDGKTYCIPVTGFWEGLFCNEALFEKHNVPMITDWESLLNAVEIFNKNDVTPIAASFLDVPNYWIENSILSAAGRSGHAVNPHSAQEIPEAWVKGLGLISELYSKDAFQEDALSTQHILASQNFNMQKAAMILDGSWAPISDKIQNQVRVVPFPKMDAVAEDDKGIIAGFSMGFYVSTKAWNNPQKREACIKYVEYMTSNESVGKLTVLGAPSADIEIGEDAPLIAKDGIKMCNENTMQMPIDSRLSKAAWEYLTQKMNEVVGGKIEPKEVLEKMVEYN